MAPPISNTQGPKVMLFDGVNILGSSANPIITDPAGVGVQPVAFVSPQHVIVDSGGGGGGGSNAAASLTGSPVPTSAGYTGFNSGGSLTGVSSATPLPVAATGTVAVSNFPVSFSISNFPATQPVSGAVSVSNFPATQPVSGTVAVSNFPATQPVSGAVSVSNFPATQPVSGTVALGAGVAVIGHVIVDTAPTTAVTLATLPALVAGSAVIGHVIADASTAVIGHVIIDSAPSTAVTNAGTFATQSTLAAETTKVIGTVNVAAGQTIAVSQATAANLNATVTQQALTKGTQGATGITVQELKDAGRNNTAFFTLLPVVTTATEALLSLTGFKTDTAVAATTTPAVVTAGKKYRITSIACTYVAIATAGSSRLSIRKTVGGVVLATSPVLWQTVIGGPAAAAGVSQTVEYAVDIEINAGDGIGVTQLGLSATQVAAAVGFGAITISGYEY